MRRIFFGTALACGDDLAIVSLFSHLTAGRFRPYKSAGKPSERIGLLRSFQTQSPLQTTDCYVSITASPAWVPSLHKPCLSSSLCSALFVAFARASFPLCCSRLVSASCLLPLLPNVDLCLQAPLLLHISILVSKV